MTENDVAAMVEPLYMMITKTEYKTLLNILTELESCVRTLHENVDSQEHSGWISVNAELPEEHTPVIVQMRSGGIYDAELADGDWYRKDGHMLLRGSVIYWMPEPPIPDTEDEGK